MNYISERRIGKPFINMYNQREQAMTQFYFISNR